MNKIFFIILTLTSFFTAFAQENSFDIYILDAYVTPEVPRTLKLTLFTSEPSKCKLVLNHKYEFDISDEFLEDHSFDLEISGYTFDSTVVPYYISAVNETGIKSRSETYDLALPADYEISSGEGASLFTMCCFGGVIFGMPSPTLVVIDGKNYFSLAKSVPVVSFYSGGYNYPTGIFSLEYAHIFEASKKNFMRFGYNQIIQIPVIEYISPGIYGFTDFKGFNGLSPELSIGWFKLYNVFTVYTKYRYNSGLNEGGGEFSEFSIGLYSSFFSINF